MGGPGSCCMLGSDNLLAKMEIGGNFVGEDFRVFARFEGFAEIL